MKRKAPIKDARIQILNEIWAQVLEHRLPASVLEQIWNTGCQVIGLTDPSDTVSGGDNLPEKAD